MKLKLTGIDESRYIDLLQYDQLSREMRAGNVFNNLKEERITFPPTYKLIPGSKVYDRGDDPEKTRIPSYTDRILYKANKSMYA